MLTTFLLNLLSEYQPLKVQPASFGVGSSPNPCPLTSSFEFLETVPPLASKTAFESYATSSNFHALRIFEAFEANEPFIP